MFKKGFFLLFFLSFSLCAKTYMPNNYTNNNYLNKLSVYEYPNFTFPEPYLMDHEFFYTDILFYYDPQVLSRLNNDVVNLVNHIDHLVEVNNKVFKKQNIPIQRSIAAILPLPEGISFDYELSRTDSISHMNLIKEKLHNSEYSKKFQASYTILIQPFDKIAAGRGELGGAVGFITPFESRGEFGNTILAHELAHMDGFMHEPKDTENNSILYRMSKPYAIGYNCMGQSSIMNPYGEQTQLFFSSPDVLFNGNQCGVTGVSDAAKAYQELFYSGYFESGNGLFSNIKPVKKKEGRVVFTYKEVEVNENDKQLIIDIDWLNAKQGDSVSVLTQYGSATAEDFNSSLIRLNYNGSSSSFVTINLKEDNKNEDDEVFYLILRDGNGINIDPDSNSLKVTLVSSENTRALNPPIVNPTLKDGENLNNSYKSEGGSFSFFYLSFLIIVIFLRLIVIKKNKK